MASKEKIKKKKTKAPSPAVSRKTKPPKEKVQIEPTEEQPEEVEPEDVQGSQVSVRSATDDNIRDNTQQDEDYRDDDVATPVPQPSSASPVPAPSMGKKKRDDHVDEKLGRETTPTPSQTLTAKGGKKRSTSPMQKNNNVVPTNPGMSSMGSAVSLRSNISRASREAWVEVEKTEKEDGEATGNRKKAKQSGSSTFSLSRENKVGPEVVPSHTNSKTKPRQPSRTGEVTRKDKERKSPSLKNVKAEEEDEDTPEKHAYIPYLYARNCIAKIMEDMKAMKSSHVVIVENISQHYSTIESETQEQFNMYVMCIKEDYANKQKAFRQVIDVHRVELEKKEQYWNEMLASLAERNNRLLREKKMLLVHNKTEIDRLEREKTNITKELTEQIDKMALAPVPVNANKPVSSDTASAARSPAVGQPNVTSQQGTSAPWQQAGVTPEQTSKTETKTETSKDIDKKVVAVSKTPVKESKATEKDAKTTVEEIKSGEGVSKPAVNEPKPVASKEEAGQITILPGSTIPVVKPSPTVGDPGRTVLEPKSSAHELSPAVHQPGSTTHESTSTVHEHSHSIHENRTTVITTYDPALVPAEMAKLEEEKKVLMDQLQTEKATIAQLQEQLSKHSVATKVMTPATAQMETATVEEVAMAASGDAQAAAAGSVVAAGAIAATKENNKQMEKEREEMEEERGKLTEERQKLDEEREEFGEQKEKWLAEISKLQAQLAEKDMEDSELKTKHDIMKARLEEAGTLQAKYQALESQYAALALVVKDSDTSGPVKEQLEKTHEEKEMMMEEKKGLEKEIKTWENEFEKKNGRKPTDEDKSDSVKEMYTTQGELEYMVTSLEQKETTLKQVEQGTIPEAPVAPTKPIDTKEPEVVTVQVKVPDPNLVEELTKTTHIVTTIKTEVTILQQEVSDLNGKISKQNEQLSTERTKVAELETQLATVKAGGGVPMVVPGVGGGASEEELEALKKENRELRRDMKKMIKQYQRLAERKENAGDGGNESEQMAEMAEAMGQMDNKLMDLESENEALKEERLILREKVRTITETITITHTEDNRKIVEEKNKKIDELLKALEKAGEENSEMQKDIKKMVKTHAKMKARLDELVGAEKAVRLLEVVAMLIHHIHCEVPDAASKVNIQLDDKENETAQSKQVLDVKQAAYQQWVDNYEKKNGKAPGKDDRDAEGERLHADWEIAKREFKEKHLHMSALQLIKTGNVSQAVSKAETIAMKAEIEINALEKALQEADNRLIDAETENKNVKMDRDRYKDKVDELEKMVEEMRAQAELNKTLLADSESSAELTEQLGELQKKADSFEADLMQERMSHVNTRDELETLRKQMDMLKEELETEKQGMEARVDGVKAHMEAQIGEKEEELKAVQARNDELEQARLANLPPDTAAEIKRLQDQLKQVKEDKSSNKSSSAALTAMVAELTSKLDTTAKNLESQRSSNRELEAKLKASRQEREKETKRVSRHMEERQQKNASEDKQRISLLVKRVKELESQAGKASVTAVPVAGAGGTSDANTHILKREIKDQAAKIKQLEKELKVAAAAGAGGKGESAADRMKAGKQEKILKELEKKLDHEKDKSEKLIEGLKAADVENQALKKELDEKNRNLAKVSAELKTIGAAAKEGIEAAAKVKELSAENKKLESENVVLTKNFESERVLRKKYFNMVEDMKGKIRVYCRARPLSKSELDRGNKAVCTSADEYSISVESTRGVKDFQYDQVFMEDSTQEKIFEDTHNLIQSAVDGYNVCIFAYGQTGSGKTFTMIGDKDQKFPGIAPRAFNGIFALIDELKNKFTIEVETYMLELYNDRLIDLFAKPNSDDEKLEIKKDKKGMVVIQGAVVKKARNAKELFALFEEGSTNRHTASTKMNAESSRSHLVIGVILESTNKNTGTVTKGKLSLVDLAGSERVAKTGAGAEQLKEAMSINKSLSALGDVISALSSEQQFIPYRNNKLTMLMQDSLGGNAKTLMFVNISPADYNVDETVISLTYASRVKLITNDASKNADNKEIARLRNIIAMMKKGEAVEEEV